MKVVKTDVRTVDSAVSMHSVPWTASLTWSGWWLLCYACYNPVDNSGRQQKGYQTGSWGSVMHMFPQTQIKVHCFELQLSALFMPSFSFPLSVFYWYKLPICGFHNDIFIVANHELDHIHYPSLLLSPLHVFLSIKLRLVFCFYSLDIFIL